VTSRGGSHGGGVKVWFPGFGVARGGWLPASPTGVVPGYVGSRGWGGGWGELPASPGLPLVLDPVDLALLVTFGKRGADEFGADVHHAMTLVGSRVVRGEVAAQPLQRPPAVGGPVPLDEGRGLGPDDVVTCARSARWTPRLVKG
jgi:hypothetical protein